MIREHRFEALDAASMVVHRSAGASPSQDETHAVAYVGLIEDASGRRHGDSSFPRRS
ncbi:hypothetical protein AKJ09_01767 [Labilithrix luteola]|uniref:Uncharacterized protein n=1 Tax=Labilithrix luteola TaxID=1391654 RepID=A0A0K1PNJ9_9BACT|nr:hypothetical protein AKJ09_01767 [Labilithrix luteola]